MAAVNERAVKHREKMSRAEMRPIQIWVPDTRKEGFIKECRRQSRLLINDSQEAEISALIENLSDTSVE
ncbi:MAG: antitoxin MazE family protein [Synergistaceae bacterium]|jgi:hypothetical protein|nr:antitoxin MazE family protein [Synergistaceae bacterium]